MAFNGSAHFKPGELVSLLRDRSARGSGRTSTRTRASTRPSTCSISRPTSRRSSRRGSTALADFAGGLTLDREEIDKERGVVIEEWRGGLGAGSRIRDKQIPDRLLSSSRYADRLPIGKPEILRTRRRRGCARSTTRGTARIGWRSSRSATCDAGHARAGHQDGVRRAQGARPAAPDPDRTVPLHEQPLVSVVADPEVTRSNVSILRKRAA